jgi:hypothetical protein
MLRSVSTKPELLAEIQARFAKLAERDQLTMYQVAKDSDHLYRSVRRLLIAEDFRGLDLLEDVVHALGGRIRVEWDR